MAKRIIRTEPSEKPKTEPTRKKDLPNPDKRRTIPNPNRGNPLNE